MTRTSPAERVLIALAVVTIVATDVAYLMLIRTQGGQTAPDVLTVPFVACFMAALASLLAGSLFVAPGARPALRAGASAGLVVLGWMGAFSIGVGLLLAALFAIAATVLALAAWPGAVSLASAGITAVLVVGVLVGGFELSWRYLVCPPNVQMSGTTAGFFGTTTYECIDGRLTTH